MSYAAGRLRHRVTIQQPVQAQDPVTGELVQTWTDFAADIAAAIEPLSTREFAAAQQIQSEIVARIVIRYRTGITAEMRVIHNGTVYNIAGVLADKDSGREYLTLPVSTGVNQG